jgi:hypothetical protein
VYIYSAKDVRRGELWSRIARGDSLSLELSVATSERQQLRFAIAGFQAGYRALGGGAANHPHYDKLQARGTATQASGSSCQENWACHADNVNSGAGKATVAIIVANLGQCTGVLLNDVPGDGAPYVLTARHCENGDPNGGAPGVAVNMSIYWDAVAPCGSPLGSIYDPASLVQYGATTVVEQQDAWLVRLDSPPAADDAYFAGWDATGATFIGGFTPHHALGTSRQFVGWYGQASYNIVPGANLSVGFTSTLWATVNAVGSTGAGASGGGLFDANARLVGTVVRGDEQTDGSGAGVCPVTSPPAPSLNSSTSLATALSGIFSSTDDPKSTTGAVTIQSVLDPNHTGKTVNDGQPAAPVLSLSSDVSSSSTGNSALLQWTALHATSCTSWGGESGDGWSGTIATSGTLRVTSYDGGSLTYNLECSNSFRTESAQVTVNWLLSAPSISFTAANSTPTYGTPFQLNWSANLRPCTASGGNAGDGWSGIAAPAGSATVTESVVGAVTYTITCGAGNRATSAQVAVTIAAPDVQMSADAVTLQVGQAVQITTSSAGLPCVSSGGSATDGWASNTTYNGPVFVSESVPGTYTYTVTCGSGGQIKTAQTTVTFVNAAPGVTLTASAMSIAANTPVTLNWDANVRPCALSITGPRSYTYPAAFAPHGSTQVGDFVLGQFVYTITCGTGTSSVSASQTVTYTGTPQLSVFQGPNAAIAGQSFLVQYAGNLLPCTLAGGSPGDGWSGSATTPNANVDVFESVGGSYTYTITCGTGSQSLQAQTTIAVAGAPPKVTLSADKAVAGLGQAVTLTWSANVSPCQASGGFPGDGWGGSVATSGSQTVSETSRNSYTYSVLCGVPPSNAAASVSVNFLPSGPPSLQASPTGAQVGQSVLLTWSSMDGSSCTASGGTDNDGWAGSRAASGSFQLRETAAGNYTYALSCGTAPESNVTVTFSPPAAVPLPPPPPSVQLAASVATVTVGTPVTLTWTTVNVDSCTAGGGSAADGWTGALSPGGGSLNVSESTAATYSYSITCYQAGQSTSATSSTAVTVNNVPAVTVTGSSGGSGHSGGGALEWFELAFLGTVLARRASRTRRWLCEATELI